MKTLKFSSLPLKMILVLIFVTGCSKEETSKDLTDINSYIRSLNYDLATILNIKETVDGNTDRKVLSDESNTTSPNKGKYQKCSKVEYRLDKNFDKVSILRPTNGIIWPGALVFGDADLLSGLPRPITLDRSPVTLRLNLPGMGDEGTLVVEDPSNSNVETAINEGLEWWNANEYQEGYVNPSLSEYQSTVSHSSKQMSMDIDMNVEWATSSVETQLDYESNEETQVALMAFKQVFYSVTMDTPSSPGDVFGKDVSLMDVTENLDESTPPAYVSSVDYGRIILLRMEAKNVSSSINLKSVLEYASGVTTGNVNAEFDQVLTSSSTSVTAITLGGNAEVASEVVSATSVGSLNKIITGKNAVYSRDNPGIPIAYTVRFLKDNSLAKMGFSTDYSVEKCETKLWDHPQILVKNKFKTANIQVKLTYRKQNGDLANTGWTFIKDETSDGKELPNIPDGAYDVVMNVETFFAGWNEWVTKNLYHVSSSESC